MKHKMSVAFTLAVLATTAHAQPPGGGFTPPTFAGLDTDKNGSLSKAEIGAFFANRGGPGGGGPNVDDIFARWDADQNGAVSQQEFDNRPRPAGPGGGPPGGGPRGAGPQGGGPPPR